MADRPSGGPGFVRAESAGFAGDMPGTRHAHGRDEARPSPCGCTICAIALAAVLLLAPRPAAAQETGTHTVALTTPTLASALPAVSNSLSALPPMRLSWSLAGNPVSALAEPPPPDGVEFLIPSSSLWLGCTLPTDTAPPRPSLFFRRTF